MVFIIKKNNFLNLLHKKEMYTLTKFSGLLTYLKYVNR